MERKATARSARHSALCAAILSTLIGIAAPVAAQSITAPGLRAPGSITYDAEGVPVIQAANDFDAAYLLGYAHARDRFFQMDFNRRGASGTVAEMVGPAGLANDVQIRTLGLRRAASATWQAMSDETRGWLKAYADGVNLWLSSNPLPVEYGALELTRAEPWSPVDSLVIGKALAFQLSFDLDIENTLRLGAYQQAGTAAGFNGTALFFEDTHRVQPPDGRVSIPGFRPGGVALAQAPDAKALGAGVPQVDAATRELAQAYRDRVANHPLIGPSLRRREDRGASNWWLIGGSRTQSGKAILANDPHLGLDTPTVFMEAHIVSTESRDGTTMNVVGSSVPGAPAILLGCTEKFCWGLTTNPLDVTDVYTERFVLNTYGLPTHTIYQGRQEPVQFLFQSYYVNQLDGTPDNLRRDNSIGYLNGAATILVPRRNNGPVLQISGETGISAQYTGWGPTFELEAFRRINRARGLDEFRDATTYFDVGSQNFAYADVDGNIAYFTSAEMPLRDDLQSTNGVDGAPPFLIRDGSGTRRNEWLLRSGAGVPNQATPYQILPPAEMPFVINPASGYIANANNDPVGTTLDNNPLNQVRPGGGLYYLNVGYSAYRMGRIDRLIRSRIDGNALIIEADVQRWQANNQLLDAELVLPYLLDAPRGVRLVDQPEYQALFQRTVAAIDVLRDWNVVCDVQLSYATPTGIQEGYDPGDDPAALPVPTPCEVARSNAATLYAVWRGQVVRNVIDATLVRVGLGSATPGGDEAYDALKNLLDTFAQRKGIGASGLNFFTLAGAPSPEAARDFILLDALADALDLLASEAFAPAFNRSTSLADYRWGRLHRIVFDHPLGGPFNIPGANPYPFRSVSAQLPGLARAGGYEAVDASSHNARANSVNGFMFGSGPARRFIGEMSTPIVAQQILPGGQSGVIGGPGYVSQLPRWLTNRYKPLNIPVGTATANPAATVSFVPRS